MPIDRRIDDRNFRGEVRAATNDTRPGNYRERNDRVERGDRMMDRGRQMSPAQRLDRDRFDRRHADVEIRRDRREDVNQSEWRGRDRQQGKFCNISLLIVRLIHI